MAETWLTRATWRHGKRQKRRIKRPYGGRTEAPQAFLEAAKKTQWRKGYQGARLCKACNQIAMQGLSVCRRHGGFMLLANKGKLIRKARPWQKPQKIFPAPLELTRLPLYQNADRTTRARLITAWETKAWAQAVKAARPNQQV